MDWSKEQWQAITHRDGPALVVAGPGSGKTAVIVNHVKYLLDQGVSDREILVLTFTRAAAEEMKVRFQDLISENTEVTFGTFHAVCFQILKEECGYEAEDLVTPDEKRRVLKEILFAKKMLQPSADMQVERLLAKIERRRAKSEGEIDAEFEPIYEAYQKKMRGDRRLDYQDLLELCYELLEKRIEIRKKWRKRFPYILVDEYQDLNPLQTSWVLLLAGEKGHVFAVGDEDQSIYRFRGADPSGMLEFQKQYPGAKRMMLSKNYRSVPEILRYAKKLIEKNGERFSKKIEATRKEEGDAVYVACFEGVATEQEAIVDEILRLQKSGCAFSEMAVLYRSIKSARKLMRTLAQRQVPFVCRDIPEELQGNWAIEDVESYYHLAMQSKWDRRDLLRILNRPNRDLPRTGLHEERIDPIKWLAQFQGIQGYDEKATQLYRHIQHLRKMDRFAFVTYLWNVVGYGDFVKEFCEKKQIQEVEVKNLVMAWRDQKEQVKTDATDGVFIMTMHSAKGLEFSTVFVPECNEGAIPHSRSLSKMGVEEERRLMYVAMTRAKDRLYLSWVKRRYQHRPPASRFLKEMGLLKETPNFHQV